MSDIREWLEELGLGQFADAFEENDIVLEHVPDLTHDVLKELGVSSIGHRITMLKAATAQAKTAAPEPTQPTDGPPAAQSTPVPEARAPPIAELRSDFRRPLYTTRGDANSARDRQLVSNDSWKIAPKETSAPTTGAPS